MVCLQHQVRRSIPQVFKVWAYRRGALLFPTAVHHEKHPPNMLFVVEEPTGDCQHVSHPDMAFIPASLTAACVHAIWLTGLDSAKAHRYLPGWSRSLITSRIAQPLRAWRYSHGLGAEPNGLSSDPPTAMQWVTFRWTTTDKVFFFSLSFFPVSRGVAQAFHRTHRHFFRR